MHSEKKVTDMNMPHTPSTSSNLHASTETDDATGVRGSHTHAPMRVVRMPEVKQRVGLSRSKIYTLIAANDFPKKIQLGLRAVGFLSSEIDKWIAGRAAVPA